MPNLQYATLVALPAPFRPGAEAPADRRHVHAAGQAYQFAGAGKAIEGQEAQESEKGEMNMAESIQCKPEQEPAPLSAEADTWIDRHLYTWARWMRRDSDELAEGYLKRSTVLVGFTHQDGRGDHLYDKIDGFVAEAVDSCMDALLPAEWAAVQNHWRLAVFRFPRGNERSLYLSAKVRLIPMLRRRNVV